MPRVTAKICGITTSDALDAAIGGGASHVGLMFFPPSPRHLGFEQAAALAERMPDAIDRVGVFVDPDDATLDAAITAARVDTIQLHNTTPARAAAIGSRTGRAIWAAVPVRTRADVAAGRTFAGAADRLLYDAKTPDGALPGGMGMRFDWALLDGVRHPLPWTLSGGLDPANVAEAAMRTRAEMVDASSGLESAPGIKDPARITAFLNALPV